MATYLPGSNAQADAMQTLYLMNPGYTGYGDSSNQGNMVLISPTTAPVGQGSPLGNNGQQQHPHQQLIGFSFPSALAQSSLPHHQQPSLTSNANVGHQNMSPSGFSSRVSGHAYNWGGGNEFSFLPSSGVLEDGQFLAAGFSSVGSGQQSSSDIPPYDLGNLLQSSYQEQAPLMSTNGGGLGLNMGNLQSSGQILSLSLSPQQPTMMPLQPLPLQHNGSAVNSCERLANVSGNEDTLSRSDSFKKCVGGGLNSYRMPGRESMIDGGYQNQSNSAASNREGSMIVGHAMVGSYGSKYLKAAQELLIEVVSVGRSLKSTSPSHAKLQSCIAPSSFSDGGSFGKDPSLAGVRIKNGEAVISWSDEKDVEAALPTSAANILENNVETIDLTPAERQELLTKKAKLMAMRDEVDRRYKQYYYQMQVVVASFESAAGLGSAKTYTALALQTISKHFRCLRDAITGQIKAASRTLGEEEVSIHTRGETPRLRLVDQHLQQQRALRQLGMMQQHAWRPQRGLPERSVSILRAWLFEHFLHPYPKDADKISLAKQTGLTRNQVSNWFINARVRLWKPMVEEMYLEETKEGECDGSDKPPRDEGGDIAGGDASSEGSKPLKQAKLMDGNERFLEQNHASDNGHGPGMPQDRHLLSSSADGLFFHDKDSSRQGPGTDFKPVGESISENDNKIRSEERLREHYSLSHNGFIQVDHDSFVGYPPFQVNGLNRYSQESLAASYAANTGVSLTLGLQHCEGLPLSQAQYKEGSLQLPTGRGQADGGVEYYGSDESSYDMLNIQNRKQFPTHMLHHDFVS